MVGRPRVYKWESLIKDPYFEDGFRRFLNESAADWESGSRYRHVRSPEIVAVSEGEGSLQDKWNRLTTQQQKTARKSIKRFKSHIGKITLEQFYPLTNFSKIYIRHNIKRFNLKIPEATSSNIREVGLISRAKEFKKFFNDNNIKIYQNPPIKGGKPGYLYFTDIRDNPAQIKAAKDFLNETGEATSYREKIKKLSKDHELYKNTSKNLRIFLKASKENFNDMIEGYNDKGIRRFLEKHPKMLQNATMWFNKAKGRMDFIPLEEINAEQLKTSLRIELEHNRSVMDYWKNLTQEGSVTAKQQLLFDSEFAHNLTLDTQRYNMAKEQVVKWIEKHPTEIKKITALENQLAELGHRFYAGGKWRGQQLEIKPTYRQTAMDFWKGSIGKSTGFKSELIDKILKQSGTKWDNAMKEVALDSRQLRILGDLVGCRSIKSYDEGGRVRLQAGGQGLVQCVDTKLKQPGAMEKVAQLPEEVGGALGKLKNATRGFLGALGKFGPAAGKFGAIAAVGALAQPLVRQFMNDDPSTYLTDPEQMEGMLLSTIEAQERPKPRSEILDWSVTGAGVGATAAAVPGMGAVYRARRKPFTRMVEGIAGKKVPQTRPGMGVLRSATIGPAMKLISGMYTPAGLLAMEPLRIAQMRREGEDWGEVAKSPTLWMGPAFADTMTRLATRGMKPGSMLSKALHLGMSRPMLKTVSRRFGMPGLALSLGLSGYDKYKDWKNKRGWFAKD